jgi:(R,R)-butanediol dehydrogenase / meso-butanediol dehydrogenase / diacetyl reductase
MKALVSRGAGNFVIEERPEPKPGAGDLLLRPAYTGVCFSDKHCYEGLVGAGSYADGLVIGHEVSAIVQAVGDGVADWKPGDLVSVDPRRYCGECPQCRGGAMLLCEQAHSFMGIGNGPDGAFADLFVSPAYTCHQLPDHVGMMEAALAEAMSCATRAVRLSGFSVHDDVVVFGAEDYGLFAVEWLKRGGARQIVVVDPEEVRRRAALALGATAVVDPEVENVEAAIRDHMPRGADVSFVCMEDYVPAAQNYLRHAYNVSRIQGTVVILRAYGAAPFGNIDPLSPWLKELTLRHFGFFFGSEPLRGGWARGDWQASLEGMAAGMKSSPPPGTIIVDWEDLRSKEDVDELFRGLPHSATKAVVRIGGG